MGLGKILIVAIGGPVRLKFTKYFTGLADELGEISRYDELELEVKSFRPDIIVVDVQFLKDGIIEDIKKILSINKKIDIIIFGKIWKLDTVKKYLDLYYILHLPDFPDDLTELEDKIRNRIKAAVRPLVLLVEDDETVNGVIKEFLEKKEYRVVQIYNGLDVMHFVQYRRPDIMVLDLGLPGIDGFTVIDKLQQLKITISTIVVSAQTDKDTILRCRKCRTAAFLPKPIDFTMLLERLEDIRLGFIS